LYAQFLSCSSVGKKKRNSPVGVSSRIGGRNRREGGKRGRTGLVGVVDVEEGEVISFGVNELSLGLVGFLSSVDRSEEDVGNCRRRRRRESAT